MSILASIAAVACVATALAAQSGSEPAAAAPAPEVQWSGAPLPAALAAARARGALVFAYFWMDGSTHCARMYGQSIQSAAAATELQHFVCFSANAGDAGGARLVQSYHVTTLPTVLVLGADGRVEDAILGFHGPADLVAELRRIRQGNGTVGALRKAASAAPDDLDLRFQLAVKLGWVGDQRESDVLFDSIRADDPRGRTLGGAELALLDVRRAIVAEAVDPNDLPGLDLAPAYRLLPRLGHPSVRFKGWTWIAGIERGRGDRTATRAAYRAAWADVATDGVMDFGLELVLAFWDMREELTAADKQLALDVARAASTRAIALLEPETSDGAGAAGGAAAGGAGGAAAGTGSAPSDELVGYVASQLGGLACALYLNGERKAAIETIERAIGMDGTSEELRGLRKLLAE